MEDGRARCGRCVRLLNKMQRNSFWQARTRRLPGKSRLRSSNRSTSWPSSRNWCAARCFHLMCLKCRLAPGQGAVEGSHVNSSWSHQPLSELSKVLGHESDPASACIDSWKFLRQTTRLRCERVMNNLRAMMPVQDSAHVLNDWHLDEPQPPMAIAKAIFRHHSISGLPCVKSEQSRQPRLSAMPKYKPERIRLARAERRKPTRSHLGANFAPSHGQQRAAGRPVGEDAVVIGTASQSAVCGWPALQRFGGPM
jgi:hypothetical protein